MENAGNRTRTSPLEAVTFKPSARVSGPTADKWWSKACRRSATSYVSQDDARQIAARSGGQNAAGRQQDGDHGPSDATSNACSQHVALDEHRTGRVSEARNLGQRPTHDGVGEGIGQGTARWRRQESNLSHRVRKVTFSLRPARCTGKVSDKGTRPVLSVSYAPEEGILVLVQSARSGTPWEGGDLRRPRQVMPIRDGQSLP